jgi:hypothetical protein
MAKTNDGTIRAPRVDGFNALGGLTPAKAWALSPSDFAFLWDECLRCFYKKVVLRQVRPRAPFPKVFGAIDRAMKDYYLGERAEELAAGAPAGVIGSPDRWVKSAPINVPGRTQPIVLRGRLDALVAADDGSSGVVDFKTALPRDTHVPLYGRQLHAYAWALERPAGGRPVEVSSLGLLCFAPDEFESSGSRAGLFGDLKWVDVSRDDQGFTAFLVEVADVLALSEAPSPAPGCPWCAHEPSAHAA